MTAATLDDGKALLLKLKQGDERAFKIIYDSYKFRLAGNLCKLLKSNDLVKDILQELFLKIWETRNQIDPEKPFKSYLFHIGQNLVYDYFRKAAKDKRLLLKLMAATSDLYQHIEEDITRKENSEIFQRAIDLMPPQRKQVFTLCKLDGKTYKEVENIMGINGKTISSHMLKANRFLKNRFQPPSNAVVLTLLGFLLNRL
ncbi:MAG: RNA polymerase sigma factor [Mucilaginibacter sp.]|uniref:RNA polymerase sigma factor n=1 Tax=Mucilaginibacter sp. TaxID=1882438 RepID=UPI0034E4F346